MLKSLLTCCSVFMICLSTFGQTSVSPLECIAPFYHGVASGDPLNDRVIIWTRVTPVDLTQTVSGTYKMATDRQFQNVIAQGTFSTDASSDFTVKVDVMGLMPNTFYFYEFECNGAYSAVGRTKTLPVGNIANIRLAAVSCANLEAGYFNAYKAVNERNDVDAVVMLGDYIYEYETGGYSPNSSIDRTWEPNEEIISLNDYRLRYSSYHMDQSLRELHQNYPWICIWDDHESANNSHFGGSDNHDITEGEWYVRKENSKQAFFEWLPIRPKPTDTLQIFRSFEFGNLFKLIMLDTRLEGRDVQLDATDPNLNDTSRTILGDNQFNWFKEQLSDSLTGWKIIGNQVMMGKITLFGTPINTDGWDGYPAERQRLYEHLSSNNIDNTVVITGDIHTSWALNLTQQNQAVGVEFVTPSVTSPGVPINVGGVLNFENPHLKYVELTKRGFVILDITPQKVQGDWYYVSTIDQISSSNSCQKSYFTISGMNELNLTNSPSIGHGPFNELLCEPCSRYTGLSAIASGAIIGVYPNPTAEKLLVQIHSPSSTNQKINVLTSTGELAISHVGSVSPVQGLSIIELDVSHLAKGSYILQLPDNKDSHLKFLKN
jgi:alkaline phosphatase D